MGKSGEITIHIVISGVIAGLFHDISPTSCKSYKPI